MAHNLILRKYLTKGICEARDYENPVGMTEGQKRHRKPKPQGPPTLAEWTERKERNEMQSLHRARTKIDQLLKSNEWEKFVTGTFDSKRVESREDYDALVRKVGKFFNNLRRKSPALEYIVVFEQHKKGGWHWHALIRGTQGMTFTPSGRRDLAGREISNWQDWRLGFSTVTDVGHSEKAETYLAKYISKECDVPDGRRRFLASHGLDRTVIEKFALNGPGKVKLFDDLRKTYETVSAKTVSIQGDEYSNTVIIQTLRARA